MTLRDVNRICRAHDHCCGCPFENPEPDRENSSCVLTAHCPQSWGIESIRARAEKWLKEHPELIYPTYYNWLTSEGVYDFWERISPEFAEKYCINPIEDASNVKE